MMMREEALHTAGGGGAGLPRWGWVVVGLLVAHVSLMAVLVTIAVKNHAASGVLPDYYDRAVSWDDHRAAQAASDALGWACEVDPGTLMGDAGRRVTVELRDAEGALLEGASVEIYCFAERRTSNVLTAEAEAGEVPGVYAAVMPIVEPGLWVIRVRAERGGDVFLLEEQRMLRGASDGGSR